MEEQQRNIDEFFRQSLGDYREEPPAAAWEAVRERLNGSNNRHSFFGRWIWVAVVLLVLGVVALLTFEFSSDHGVVKKMESKPPLAVSAAARPADLEKGAKVRRDNSHSDTADVHGQKSSDSRAAIETMRDYPAAREHGKRYPEKTNERRKSTKSSGKMEMPVVSTAKPSTSNETRPNGQQRTTEIVKATRQGNVLPASRTAHSNTVDAGTSSARAGKLPGAGGLDQNTAANAPSMVQPSVQLPEQFTVKAPLQSTVQPTTQPKIQQAVEATVQTTTAQPTIKRVDDTTGAGTGSHSKEKGALLGSIPTQARTPDTLNRAVVLPSSSTSTERESSATSEGVVGSEKSDQQGKPSEKDTIKKAVSGKVSVLSVIPLAGYEFGNQGMDGRLVGSLRLLWNINPSFAVGIQPAYRVSDVEQVSLAEQRVYQINSSEVVVDSFVRVDPGNPFFRDFGYYFSQSYDSIVVPGSRAGGRLWEVDMPLMLQYKVPRTGLQFFAGPALVFSNKLTRTTNGKIQSYTITRSDSIIFRQAFPPELPADTFGKILGQSTLPPFSAYDPNAGALNHPSLTRFGYTLGIGYEWRRVVFSASVHKQLTGYSSVNEEFKKLYSAPYFRMSLGYRILGGRSARKKNELEAE